MSWWGPGALRGAIPCLILVSCGCEPSNAVPRAEAPDGPRPGAAIGRGDYGLGDRMALYALADSTSSISRDPSPFRFTNIREGSGIDFVHFSGMDDEKNYPTAFGSGVGLFDYDGDGRIDLYFATCTLLPLGKAKTGPNKLYKNLGAGKFRDVTAVAGLGFAGFCHGIIVGDIDNDGDPDVFLCNYGPNVLYLNDGAGRFRDISHAAGIDRSNWSLGGAMLDYDNDGDLDIYVANYGEWQYPRDARPCGTERIHLYCLPRSIRTVRHILYRNNGDRTFTDVTDQAGLSRSDGHGFGAVAVDVNGDGRVDLYVANDLDPKFLYLNRGDGTFEDATETSGAAFDERGVPQASMGVDAEDCDGDGRPELFVTNYQYEYSTYYQNLSGSVSDRPGRIPAVVFRDSSASVGLVADSTPWIGWGCALADFDNDGWPDCFVANGHIDDNREQIGPNLAYAEPSLLHRNVPAGDTQNYAPNNHNGRRFQLSTRDVGPYFSTKHVARGAAFGDLDNDGDIDIVVNHKDGAPAILRNDTPGNNRWIRLNLVGTCSNRDAIGARVEVDAGGRTITRQRKGGCSLESAHDPRLLIGLGAVNVVERVTIHWPSGGVSTLEHLTPNKAYEVVEPREKDGNAVAVALPDAGPESK
jgi:enediyne biosynthesis protein E4